MAKVSMNLSLYLCPVETHCSSLDLPRSWCRLYCVVLPTNPLLFSLSVSLFITVPAPKHLTLERQLNKSVLIGWSPPEPVGYNLIDSYHVYVDGVLKVTVKANERTRALIEGVDSTRVSYQQTNLQLMLNSLSLSLSFPSVAASH